MCKNCDVLRAELAKEKDLHDATIKQVKIIKEMYSQVTGLFMCIIGKEGK